MVEQNAIEALRISSQCIVMANGSVRLCTDAAAVLGMPDLQALYLGMRPPRAKPSNGRPERCSRPHSMPRHRHHVALPALAVTLLFGVLKFANFAVGAMMTVAAYMVYALNTDSAGRCCPPPPRPRSASASSAS